MVLIHACLIYSKRQMRHNKISIGLLQTSIKVFNVNIKVSIVIHYSVSVESWKYVIHSFWRIGNIYCHTTFTIYCVRSSLNVIKSLGIVFWVKLNHYNMLQCTIDLCRRLYTYEYTHRTDVTQQRFMCIGNGYAYFTNYDLILGHNPNTLIIDSCRKSGLT